MSTTPGWRLRIDPNNEPPEPPPEPSLGQRIGNFFTRDVPEFFTRTIPDWIRNTVDWARHQVNLLRQFFRPNPGVNLNGVDPRLIHVASAIGAATQTNSVSTDAQRSRNAGYGATNSEHHRGNAMDMRLSSVPGRTHREREQFVADIATVLGYGGQREQDRIYASVHGGTGLHLHFQFGSNNIAHLNPAASTRGGQADLVAAQQRIERLVGQDGLQRIMQTRAPDELAPNAPNRYAGYQQQPAPQGPRLVYSQAGPQPYSPRPLHREDHPPTSGWRLNIRPTA